MTQNTQFILNTASNLVDTNPIIAHSKIDAIAESTGIPLEDLEICYTKMGGEIHPDKTCVERNFNDMVAQAARDFVQDIRDCAFDLVETRGSRAYMLRLRFEIKHAIA